MSGNANDGTLFADGIVATMDNQESTATPIAGGRRKGVSQAQKLHILKVRAFFEASTNLQACDWRNILFHSAEWSTPQKYYVKASAAWVPHLLEKNFHPYCPDCEKPVPNIDYWWVDQPMIMFGITGHRFLDTVRYKCACCGKSFRATNTKSLSLDTTGFVSSTFQVHLLSRCAVDQELYGYITSSIMSPTSVIVASLKDQAMKQYLGHLTQYYQVLLQKKAAGEGLVRHHHGSGSIVEAFSRCQSVNGSSHTLNRTLSKKQRELRDAKLHLRSVERSQNSPVSLKSLGGIGVAKDKRLASVGVRSGQDLVLVYEQKLAGASDRFNEVCQVFQKREAVKIVKRYVKQVVLILLRDKAERREQAEDRIKSLESEITTLEEENIIQDDVQVSTQSPPDSESDISSGPFQVVPFSKFCDQAGYNGRFFSPYYVEHVLNWYFQLQKPGMKARVCNLGGEVLSIDFQYKSANRVKVYVNGKPFSPFKSMATILNEHNMVVWWAFLRGLNPSRKLKQDSRP